MSSGHLVPPLGPQDLRPRTDYAAGPRVSAVHKAGSQLTRSTRLPDTWLSDAARSRKPAHQVRKAAGRLVKRCRDPNCRPAAAVRTVSRSNCPSRTPRSRFLFLVFASKAYRRAELPFPLRPVTGHTIHIITDTNLLWLSFKSTVMYCVTNFIPKKHKKAPGNNPRITHEVIQAKRRLKRLRVAAKNHKCKSSIQQKLQCANSEFKQKKNCQTILFLCYTSKLY
ncbi:hypothetical protein HPB51_011463 [Rhipicephalus microplus]|uniref:Uncharacterized protein n=1 Tax=Rhipicephalus microplus TaxID=6941 RepID=A0A9J6DV28_RHIMP|nr:hypothetical protein HPB51_011463 [Rhipicephalus microplus]